MNQRIKEMLNSSNVEMKELGKVLKEEEDLKALIGLNVVKKIQEAHRELILTGSVALYLHGIKFRRWNFDKNVKGDLDFIAPYFVKLHDNKFHVKDYTSAFQDKWQVDGYKVEVAIDRTQQYETIELDEFEFKVSPLQDIWYWKMLFAREGKTKHIQDLQEALGITPLRNIEYDKKILAEQEKKRREWSSGS